MTIKLNNPQNNMSKNLTTRISKSKLNRINWHKLGIKLKK